MMNLSRWPKHFITAITRKKAVPPRRRSIFAAALALIVLSSVIYYMMRPPENISFQKQSKTPAQAVRPSPIVAQKQNIHMRQIELLSEESLAESLIADAEFRARVALDWPEGMTRIRRQIEVLSDESLTESMDNLYQVNMFSWPGGGHEGGFAGFGKALPLRDKAGESDLDNIISNRRFVRIFEELTQMPKESAADLVADHLDTALSTYQSLFNDFVTASKSHFRADSAQPNEHGAIIGPVWIGETEDEKQVVLLGARYNVLSLVWIAGSLDLAKCHGQVKEVARQSMLQREWSYNEDELHDFYRSVILEKLSLYNRQILAFGLAGTSDKMKDLKQMLSERGVRQIRLETSRFDALLTPYDLPVRSGHAEPDMSKGVIEIECYGAVDDSTLDELISACTSQD